MESLVAKRYVRALEKILNEKELEAFKEQLALIAKLYEDEKIRALIFSPEIKSEIKAKLLLDALKPEDKRFVNFIQLLAQKKRLTLIPVIVAELEKELAIMHKRFTGKVYSEYKLTQKDLAQIAKALEKRIGASIQLQKVKEPYDGIKVEVDIVGLEIEFSRSKLKKELIESILKAI